MKHGIRNEEICRRTSLKVAVLWLYVFVNLKGAGVRTIEINAGVSLNACRDISLAVEKGKTKYMELGCHWGMMANKHIMKSENL